MISLKDSNITDILPEVFAGEPETVALGYAIKRAMRRLLIYIERTRVYSLIDSADDAVLDMLAAELDTQYYDADLELEAKRRLVKGALVWHMTSGTPAAVEELVAAVFGEGEVTEWYEYGDDPYYFKITTNATMTEDTSELFTVMINRVKNARSHLRAIEIHREIDHTLYAGTALHSSTKPAAIIDGYSEDRAAESTVYAGTAESISMIRPDAVRDGFDEDGSPIQQAIAVRSAMTVGGYRSKITEQEE